MSIIAVNYEDDAGSPALNRMIKRDIHPAINIVQGTSTFMKYFGDVPGVPTVFMFDKAGRQVLRAGQYLSDGDASHLDRALLEKTLARLN